MSYYRDTTQNPYRNSTGGLNLSSHSRSPPRTQIIIPRPPSPADSHCSSCDDSLPLNTPWSGTPTSSVPRLQNERVCTRTTRRRMSTHSDDHHRPDPLVIRGDPRYVSSAPLSAPLRERRTYITDHSTRALIVPSSSMERSRRSASSDGRYRSASTASRNSYSKYHQGVERFEEEYNDGTTAGRRGRTRFPRKLVNREAIEQLGLPWTEEHDGALVVLRALDRTEIDRLVDLTEEIRRRGNGSGKSVSFVGEEVIHDIPRAPSPPPLINERIVHRYSSDRPTTSDNISRTNSRGHDSSFSHTTTTTTTTTTEEPILLPIRVTPPGATKISTTFTTPSFPLPQDSLSRAEEKAIKAEEKAIKLEVKADMTGSRRDEQEAYRARVKAEEKKKKFEEKEWKERVRREEKETRRIDEREVIRTKKTHRGETVIIR